MGDFAKPGRERYILFLSHKNILAAYDKSQTFLLLKL